MPRAIWSGSISFGLVNVPVKLFAAVSPKDIHFHMLHDADGARIQQKRVCSADGKEVPYEHIVKGYEISPDRYVVIKPQELEALDPKASRMIEIESFVQLEEIDPLFYEHSYYLVPDEGAAKAYTLLQKAMKDANAVAIARAVIRSKQYVVILRAMDAAMGMSTLYYQDEIVAQNSLPGLPEKVEVDAKQLTMAQQLIESLTTEFDPSKYKDDYRKRVLEMIEKKAEGETIAVQPMSKEKPKVINLMEALEASLAAARKGTEPAARKGAATAPPREKKSAAAHGKAHAKKRKTA